MPFYVLPWPQIPPFSYFMILQASKEERKDEQLAPIIEALNDGISLPSKVAPGLHRTFLHDGVLYR